MWGSKANQDTMMSPRVDSGCSPLSLIGQPTVRLWIVGNPISGHGKGKEHLDSLGKAIQEQLVMSRLKEGKITLDHVHMPLWTASEFFSAIDSSTCEVFHHDDSSVEGNSLCRHRQEKNASTFSRLFDTSGIGDVPQTAPVSHHTSSAGMIRNSFFVPVMHDCPEDANAALKGMNGQCGSTSIDSSNVRTQNLSGNINLNSGSVGMPSSLHHMKNASSSFKEAPLAQSLSAMQWNNEETVSSVPPPTSGMDVQGKSDGKIESRMTVTEEDSHHPTSFPAQLSATICGGPAIYALMVFTEASKDGYKLLERMTQLIVEDRLFFTEQFLHANASPSNTSLLGCNHFSSSLGSKTSFPKTMDDIPYPFRDIMVIVGGDGTLSEGINGICYGVRKEYSSWLQRQGFTSVSTNSAVKMSTHSTPLSTVEVLPHTLPLSVSRDILKIVQGSSIGTGLEEEVLHENRAIESLAPYVLYSPSGTGADFAKLGVCSSSVTNFTSVIKDFSQAFFYSYISSNVLSPQSSLSNGFVSDGSSEREKQERKGFPQVQHPCVGNFGSIAVDVGRICFPKTGRVQYFINECSMGMSVEVIQRTNRFRKSSLLATLGGTVIFGSASFVSLVEMAPTWIRVMRLPPRLHPSSPCCDFYCSRNPASGGNSVGINPLYNYHEDMWNSLEVAKKVILDESNVKTEGLQEERSEKLESGVKTLVEEGKTIVTKAAKNIICFTNEDTRKELDWIVDEDTPSKAEKRSSSPFSNQSIQASLSTVVPKNSDCAPNLCQEKEKTVEVHHCAACIPSSSLIVPHWAYLFSSTICFGNGRWYGGGMQVTPHGDPTDHLLSVTKWRTSFWEFVCGICGLYNGNHHNWESTSTFDGSRFLLDAGPREPQCGAKDTDAAGIHLKRETTDNEDPKKINEDDVRRGACTMLLEADGELLEELPACIEIGPTLKMLYPRSVNNGDALQLNFGSSLPGTTRFRRQQEV